MLGTLLSPLLKPALDKVLSLIPDSNARKEAEEQLQREIIIAANQVNLGQLEVNKQEAAHKSIFVAGWRPAIGWVCAFSIGWAFVAQPIATWAIPLWSPGATVPQIDTGYLMELVMAMLGMGGLRTFEKIRGIAREK